MRAVLFFAKKSLQSAQSAIRIGFPEMTNLFERANEQLRDLVNYVPGKPIEDVARELGLQPEKIVKLASNANPIGPSPKAVAAMQAALEKAHYYPDGGGYHLRSAIAQKLEVTRDNVKSLTRS